MQMLPPAIADVKAANEGHRGRQSRCDLHNPYVSTRKLRERLLADPDRPRYHIVAPEGVHAPFDPNGALYWRGRYHLMYIVKLQEGFAWAHVSSHDLVHWRQHPLALEPGDCDDGIFSGGAFVDREGRPTLVYWGLGERSGICLARARDEKLDLWEKIPENPVIPQCDNGVGWAPNGELVGVADPSAVWQRDGRYYLLTGNLLVLRDERLDASHPMRQGDRTYLWVSDDLVHWEYLHPFYESRREWTQSDEDDMCPDFFPLGDRHMLLFISHNRGCQYYLGRYVADRFTAEAHGRMTWADRDYFAPESLLDGQGRRIMWAWVFDGRRAEVQEASGWSGTLSLPRVLWLSDDGELRMGPPEELATLRRQVLGLAPTSIAADGELVWEGPRGRALELDVTLDSSDANRYGLVVCRAADGSEETVVRYDADAARLEVDTTRSSLGEGSRTVESAPLSLGDGEALRLRVFIDQSVLEVYANERLAIVRRIYPTRAERGQVVLFSEGGSARVVSAKAWEMAPANAW